MPSVHSRRRSEEEEYPFDDPPSVGPHMYDPRLGDTWCRDCNSAPGEPGPHLLEEIAAKHGMMLFDLEALLPE